MLLETGNTATALLLSVCPTCSHYCPDVFYFDSSPKEERKRSAENAQQPGNRGMKSLLLAELSAV